ncbi:hypothetical protein ACJRO7_020062 [Eucalyptus globulus]|uniref:Uncharacterized protein n=1 Tax=Eucalyptus globulus TaxID=34317 RepID=A0ABD3KL68_EUCGL
MAEAVVPSLLRLIPDLLKLLKEEWNHGSEAKTELECLEDLIGAIGHFLKKANSKKDIDEDLKASMKRMRKFLYDSEDALDDFMKRKNCNLEGLGVYIYKHINRRTFASEAQSIRKIVENYKTTLETSNALSADHAKSSSACHQSLFSAFSNERDNELVGIKTAREQLVGWLTTDSPTRKVIFVHGAQGVGKTSLVGTVLRDETVKRRFRYYVWIKDLRSCELLDNKAAALMKANAEIWDLTKNDSLGFQLELEEVFRRLWKKNVRWVLVLDDAGSTHVFESLRSLLAQSCPTMLVTTQDSSLASNSRTFLDSQMAQSDGATLEPAKLLYEIHHFRHVFLSLDDSSTLLCRKMFQKDAFPDVLKDASDGIVKQCGGLPLAILAASNLLSNIHGGVNGTPRSVVWKKLSGRLGEALLLKRDKSGLIRRMITLRMDHLHDVRACLFYLSIFPIGHRISCSTLMRLWMAERFIEQKGTNPAPTIAEETLKKLVDHNLFQEVMKTNYDRAKTCLIYNILHQIIISNSKEDEFAMIIADPEEGWPETVWRLSIHSKLDSIKDGTKVKRLRSLLVFGEVYPASMEALLKQVSRLNVLDIQGCSLEKFPNDILHLRYLRYLRLRDTHVTAIPEGIGNLEHLETLDLKNTGVTELPENILKLKALRHLLVYRSDPSPDPGCYPKYGVRAPSRLGDLTSLQKLCLIDLDKVRQSTDSHGKELLIELGKLENLQRLGISNLRRDHGEHLCSSIGKLQKLETLHLIAGRNLGMLDLSTVDKTKAFPFLQRVHLTGYMGTLPTWILSSSLAKLFIRGSRLNVEKTLQHIKGLPCLKHLDLQDAFLNAIEMKFEEGGFQQLCFLGLDIFPNLESITVAKKALPTLERLSLAQCRSLTTVPRGMTGLEQLKCLELYKMPKAFMTAIRQDKAVQAHGMTVQEREWKPPAAVRSNATDPPTVQPESYRPSRTSRK